MNVLVLELGGSHIECIYTFVHLLDKKGCRVHLACNRKLVALFPEKERLQSLEELPDDLKGQQIKTFLKIRKWIGQKQIDVLIINTTDHKMVRNLVFFLPRIPCIGLVHNAKRLENSFTFSKILTLRIQKFLVLGDYLLQQVQERSVHRIDSFYPIYFPAPSTVSHVRNPGEYWIAIPGKVEEGRRDYIAFIRSLEAQQVPSHFRFLFLGFLDKNETAIREALTASGKWGTQLITFDEFLGYDDFHSYLQQTDLLLPLLKFGEGFYSNKRISGSFNLAIGYRLPLLLSASYFDNTDLRPFSLYYDEVTDIVPLIETAKTEELARISRDYAESKLSDYSFLADKLYRFIQPSNQ